MHTRKTAFVVEHDFIMATYLADRVVVYDGVPAHSCVARRYVLFYLFYSILYVLDLSNFSY